MNILKIFVLSVAENSLVLISGSHLHIFSEGLGLIQGAQSVLSTGSAGAVCLAGQ